VVSLEGLKNEKRIKLFSGVAPEKCSMDHLPDAYLIAIPMMIPSAT